MGNCIPPSSSISSTSSAGTQADWSPSLNSSELRKKKQSSASLKKQTLAQTKSVNGWIQKFKDIEAQIDEIRDQLIASMKNGKMYRSLKLDRIIGEVYYQQSIPNEQLLICIKTLKQFAVRLHDILQECENRNSYYLADADSIETLESFIDKFNQFIEVASKIPEIQEEKFQREKKKTLSEVFPVLTKSQSIR